MSKATTSNRLILFRLIPLLLLVCFLGWCSTANRQRQSSMPVASELADLFQENGLLDASHPDLASAARSLGETGMNRLLYQSAPTASLPALQWMVDHGADPRHVGRQQDLSLLQMAAKSGKSDKLNYFLGFDLDPLARTGDGRTLVHLAAEGGLSETTLTLLTAKGLKVNDQALDGSTPLHSATFKSVPVLLRAGADINAVDHAGRTPLHSAVLREDNETVNELIRQGASVFAADLEGRTPLHLAATRRSDAVVDSLLAAGAMKATRDLHNLTPRELAEQVRDARYQRRHGSGDFIDKL